MAKKEESLRIKYVRSVVGRPKRQKEVIQGLGFRRLNQVVERLDTASIRGMVAKVSHLVQIVGREKE